MKKFLILFTALTLSIALAGCTKEVEVPMELTALPEVIDMTNLDDFLGRPDVQYIDVRDFDERMYNGYIDGFDALPFKGYLEVSDILVRTDGNWEYDAADMHNEVLLETFFATDKTIFIMCAGGTRAGYVKAALEAAGLTNKIYNVGGFGDYAGDNKIFGDTKYNVEIQLPLPATVDMTTLDMYMNRTDVQYVDLRDFDEKMYNGYVMGFEALPFKGYLEMQDILVRTDGDWNYDAADMHEELILESFFSTDKAIFLMCAGGTRAGYVKAALEAAGFTNAIYNIGGFGQYSGDYKVFGDTEFGKIAVHAEGPYTPGTYFAVDPQTQYTTTLVVGAGGAIEEVIFDAMYHGTTKNTLDTAYELGSGITWKTEAEELAAYVLANQGWGDIALNVTDITGMNALTAPHHIITIDHTGTVDAVAGVSIGAEGFVLSWNLAIAQATTAGTTGLVTGVPTSAEWTAAHAPAFTYTDGVYFGMDEASGYNAKVTIVDGFIVDVFFDALKIAHEVQTDVVTAGPDYIIGTADDIVVPHMSVITEYTTKQTLGELYIMAGGNITWQAQTNRVAASVVKAQEWSAAWLLDDGAFDLTDTDTNGVFGPKDATYNTDAIAGMSIGVDGFEAAFAEAIAQAIPAS